MKNYIGTKRVKAEPMNELAAVENGYARKNEDNHEWREGYHVQYTNPDGSTYDSWSPKQVFEISYKCTDSFLDRLQIELEELAARINGLNVFISKGFDYMSIKVGHEQASMLIKQHTVMSVYYDILEKRIEDLKKNGKAAPLTQG